MRNTNLYESAGSTTIITTAAGRQILVDTEDVPRLSRYTWCVEGTGYAMSRSGGNAIKMHRFLLDASKGNFVDHINGNRLDNRKQNLRICKKQQNEFNAKVRADSTTGFRGVSFEKRRHKYRAYITIDQKQQHIGSFDTAEAAARAYNDKALQLFGDFARLNIV